MSFQAMAWAIGHRVGGPGPKMVLLALANYADESGSCWPSHELLAAEAEVSVSSVKAYLVQLRDLGLIWWEQRIRNNGSATSNRYYLNLTKSASRSAIPAAVPVDNDRSNSATTGKSAGQSGSQNLATTKTDNRGALGVSGSQDLATRWPGSGYPRGTNHLEPEKRGVRGRADVRPREERPEPPREIDDRKPAAPAPDVDVHDTRHPINRLPRAERSEHQEDAARPWRAEHRQHAPTDHQGLPVVVPARCPRHVDDDTDTPCRACADARVRHDLSRRARADALTRLEHARVLAADAAARRAAAEVRESGRLASHAAAVRAQMRSRRPAAADDATGGHR